MSYALCKCLANASRVLTPRILGMSSCLLSQGAASTTASDPLVLGARTIAYVFTPSIRPCRYLSAIHDMWDGFKRTEVCSKA